MNKNSTRYGASPPVTSSGTWPFREAINVCPRPCKTRLGINYPLPPRFLEIPITVLHLQKTIHSATVGQRISVAAMSTSPPPTPPSRAVTDDDRRFKTITLPCEWVEDYRPGGYHPVVLDGTFNGQYRVIRKLGEGSYSTVWLARDLK